MGREPSRNLNPDECVAMGAAIQGGKLGNQLVPGSTASEIILMDVTPLSLSIETFGGIASRLIERNTTIPTRHSQIFTTVGNYQTSVDIKVYQGERKFTKDNKLIANFRLSGIRRAMAGIPQIEVTFDIDVNGIVNVSAKDLDSNNEQSVTITSSSNMSEDEIERAKWEADIYGKQDEIKGELVEMVLSAENMVKVVSAMLKEHKKDWDKEKRKNIKETCSMLSKAIGKTTPEKVTEIEAQQIRQAVEQMQYTLEKYNIKI